MRPLLRGGQGKKASAQPCCSRGVGDQLQKKPKKMVKNSAISTAVEQIGVVFARVSVLVSSQRSKTPALCFFVLILIGVL